MDQCFPGGRGSFAELRKVCAWPQLFLSMDNVTGAFAATLPGISWTLMEMRHLQLLKNENLFPGCDQQQSDFPWEGGFQVKKCGNMNCLTLCCGEIWAAEGVRWWQNSAHPGHFLELGAFALISHLHLGVGVGNRDHAGTDWEKLTLTSEQNWWIWWGC